MSEAKQYFRADEQLELLRKLREKYEEECKGPILFIEIYEKAAHGQRDDFARTWVVCRKHFDFERGRFYYSNKSIGFRTNDIRNWDYDYMYKGEPFKELLYEDAMRVLHALPDVGTETVNTYTEIQL